MNARAARGRAQRARTRETIVRAAIPIFAEHGPDLPVIDDFAKAAGVSRGTFYNYFQTTRELLEAAMTHVSDEVTAAILPVVTLEPNPLLRYATAVRMFYRKARLDPLFRAFIGSVSGFGVVTEEHVRADLTAAMEKGLITIKDIELAMAIAIGVMVYALRSSDVESAGPERSREVARAILAALGASPELIEQALQIRLPPASTGKP